MIKEVFKAFAKIYFQEPKPLVEVPDGEGEHAEEARESVHAQNEEINKHNEALKKLHSFVNFISPE